MNVCVIVVLDHIVSEVRQSTRVRGVFSCSALSLLKIGGGKYCSMFNYRCLKTFYFGALAIAPPSTQKYVPVVFSARAKK